MSATITRADAKPGMAHFAGTGPKNKTCKDCAHRGFKRGDSNYTYWGCAKYRSMMGVVGPEVDSNYRSCRYFEQRQDGKQQPRTLTANE